MGLGQAEDVAALEGRRDGLELHRTRLGETCRGDAALDVRSQVEVFEHDNLPSGATGSGHGHSKGAVFPTYTTGSGKGVWVAA
jgi:hypothetical protein